jgi:hypothetical protein
MAEGARRVATDLAALRCAVDPHLGGALREIAKQRGQLSGWLECKSAC